MGIVRTFTLAVVVFVAATCCQGSETNATAQVPPPDRLAMYGATHSLGGSTYQWSVLIDVNALKADGDAWTCNGFIVTESTRQQELFASRLNVALAKILANNPHCTIATLSTLTYGANTCGNASTSNPSGAYAVFSCPNGEPLITTHAP